MVDSNTHNSHSSEQQTYNPPLLQENISQLMQLVPDAIIIVNHAQRIIHFNLGAEKTFGYSQTEIYNQPLSILLPERYHHSHDAYVKDYMQGNNRSTDAMERGGQLYACRKNGEEFPIEATITTLETADGKIGAVILREISQRKAYEAAILERNAELDAFAHTVAHDLKGPLHHMLGFSTVLHDDLSLLDAQEFAALQKYASYIQRAAVKAGNIINELLLLASVRREDVEPIKLDMDIIVNEAIKRLELEIAAASAVIHLPAGNLWPDVLGHPAWIEEIWINYISNAIKYSGTPPEITLSATPLTDGFVRFMVIDNGNGVPPEKHDLLFAPFTRLDVIRTEGHGLGLSIVRRITDKLGGRAGLLDTNGDGAHFYFDLPAMPREV